ncbi:hypothetical protein [Ensifer aridi]|uniref:hypothetical protein n=1 Tax=Ensifer aridi TaxID=1708715 RepID=UPI00358F53DE
MSINVRFACPTCQDVIVEGPVDNAEFDWSLDSSADGVGTAISPISCGVCETEYQVMITAKGGEKEASIVDRPEDISVGFHDTYDPYLDRIADEEMRRFGSQEAD